MSSAEDYEKKISKYTWVEGKHTRLSIESYRHALVIVSSKSGRQTARFANGKGGYFAYNELLDSNRNWIAEGINIVPVLPDGKIVMVVEKRPALSRYSPRPERIELDNGESISLGPYDSLEFPGGGLEQGEMVIIGARRELVEETELVKQTGTLYQRIPPIYPFSSDLALRNYYLVVFLSSGTFSTSVENDGGLSVLALTQNEIARNIEKGVIASGQAALLGWQFYLEVAAARQDPELKRRLQSSGYLRVEEIEIRLAR